MIVVSVARNSQIQQRSDQTHAEALLPTAVSGSTIRSVESGEKRVHSLWKEHSTTDEDGRKVGKRRERVGIVTLLRAEYAEVPNLDLGMYDAAYWLDVARGCGHKTVSEWSAEWDARHPRSPRAVIVWFALGDWRDQDLFMNWSGRAGGDFIRNSRRAMDPDAPVLTREQIEALSSVNRQKDEGRRAQTSAALATETPSQRLKRLDAATARIGDEARRAIRQELRIIEQRVRRGEGRK